MARNILIAAGVVAVVILFLWLAGDPEHAEAIRVTTTEATTTTEPPTTTEPTTTTTEAPAPEPAPAPVRATTAVPAAPRPTVAAPAAPTIPVASGSGACGGDLPPCRVMRRESGGDPTAIGRGQCGADDCYGKWQFDPDTAESLGYPRRMDLQPEEVQDQAARDLMARDGCGQWSTC